VINFKKILALIDIKIKIKVYLNQILTKIVLKFVKIKFNYAAMIMIESFIIIIYIFKIINIIIKK
jgi:hypothetical protein